MKVALMREDDGTPSGFPAPCFFRCPCGQKVPVYDREGRAIGMDEKHNRTCGCGQKFDYAGFLVG
jgi:hypothetical protein